MQQQLRGSALRAEVDEAGKEDAGVDKDAHGQRFRSSSTRAAMSMAGRSSRPTVGRATRRRPIFMSLGPMATRSRRMPRSSSVTSSSDPADKTARSRMAAGITTRPALSMVVRMAGLYHYY